MEFAVHVYGVGGGDGWLGDGLNKKNDWSLDSGRDVFVQQSITP